MSLPLLYRNRIQNLKAEFEQLKDGKSSLLDLIDESEIPENVYNSNAIENSTITLKQTEQILLQMDLSSDLNLREVYETKNLALVTEYIRIKSSLEDISIDLILLLHKMLLGNIEDNIAGRFRKEGEYVRIGSYIAPGPDQIEAYLKKALLSYKTGSNEFFTDVIAKFHVEFERIHPFNDGNGRIGRVLINYSLLRVGFPPIIIRNKEKQDYYKTFRDYEYSYDTKGMELIMAKSLIESLHKRIAYLQGKNIIKVTEYAKETKQNVQSILNAAKRQTIPAFREKAVWKIGV